MTTTEKPTRADYVKQLKKGEHIITYRKKSTGKTETMTATLDKNLIPPSKLPEGKLGGENKEVIAVWNTAKKAWRSPRYESIKNIKPL